MTTLAILGDVHGRLDVLEKVLSHLRLCRFDGVLLVGDLGSADVSLSLLRTPEGDVRYLASVARVLDEVRALGRPVLWVPGNHDLPDVPGEGNVDGRVVRIGDLRVGGIGGAGPNRFGFCYEWGEDDLRRRPRLDCDVLLCHAPPANTPLDLVLHRDDHAGSVAIREIALRHTGFLVCGHIHESSGAAQLGSCLCLNAGALGEPYGKPQVAFLRRQGGADEAWHDDLAEGVARSWKREGR